MRVVPTTVIVKLVVAFNDDMLVPPQKETLISAAEQEVKQIEQQCSSGPVTAGERYNAGRRVKGAG